MGCMKIASHCTEPCSHEWNGVRCKQIRFECLAGWLAAWSFGLDRPDFEQQQQHRHHKLMTITPEENRYMCAVHLW